jgi:hypothetical protein
MDSRACPDRSMISTIEGLDMCSIDHVKISRLLESAIDSFKLTELEIEHQTNCNACQDLFEIFRKELGDHLAASDGKADI